MNKKTEKTYTVNSSHGTIVIDQHGYPIEYDRHCNHNCERDCLSRYRRFDLHEYFHYWQESPESVTDFDILDLGAWIKDGDDTNYDGPDNDFREEVRRARGKAFANRRAAKAESTLEFFLDSIGSEGDGYPDQYEATVDLLVSLRHLCDVNQWRQEDLLRAASDQYATEVEEFGEAQPPAV